MEETAISGRSSLLQFAGCGGCHGAGIDYRCSRLAVAARRAAAKGYPPDAPHTRLGFQPAELDRLSRPPESTAQTRRSSARLPPAHGGDRSCTGDGNRTPRRILERREWAGIQLSVQEDEKMGIVSSGWWVGKREMPPAPHQMMHEYQKR